MMNNEFATPELPSIGLVSTLLEDDRNLLSSYGEFLPVHPDQTLVEEGQPQDSLFLVISGLLHASSSSNRNNVLLGRILPGECIGEVNMFDPGKASATVRAIEFSQVWRIDRPMLEDFMNEHPLPAAKLLLGISMNLSRRLRRANQKIAVGQQGVEPDLISQEG